jgi:cyclopropane-fatty-acyl-phospholipid synthase
MESTKQLARPRFSARFLTDSLLDQFARRLLFSKLAGLKKGWIRIDDPTGETSEFGDPNAPLHERVQITVHRARTYSRIAFGGSIGTGESFIDGDWDCDQLTELVRIFVANRDVLNSLDGGTGSLFAPLQHLAHSFRNNSIQGSKKNISAHYDLGNDFFALFLDDTWMYSCGVFLKPESTLFEASTEKNDRICRKLALTPNDHLIEIGTGWGGFAIHAAKNYGCRITTTTISRRQYELAVQRIQEAGLSDRIQVLFEDYRNLTGVYDKAVSIEMIEAVGLDHLDEYFSKCSSLLKPGGKMVLQGITIRDQFYEQAKKNVDFIQHCVFPGSGIPSIGCMAEAIMKNTDMQIFGLEDIGSHYAETLKRWSQNLERNHEQVLKLAGGQELYRLWRYYLSYCEGGFLEKSISCVQLEVIKPC